MSDERQGFDFLPRLVACRTVEQRQALDSVAASDDHQVICPTHLATRSGEIVGYASIGGAIMLNTWVHSKRVRARESMYLLNMCENLAPGPLILPCAESSPFTPYLEQFGYRKLGKTVLYLKG